MSREALHELIDRIPESEIVAAQRVLERLASDAALRAAMSAPPDDEPVTAGDAEAIARARKDLQAGMAVSHDEREKGHLGRRLTQINADKTKAGPLFFTDVWSGLVGRNDRAPYRRGGGVWPSADGRHALRID
jgi:hypothetical protein